MELKHIIARDAKAAADRATALFGRDALIISSHQVGGQTELVVAVDCKEQALAAGARVPQGARAARAPAHAAVAEPAAGGKDFRRDLVRAQEVAPAVAEQRPVGPRQELPGSATTNERDYLRSREIVQAIREEIAALRRDIVLGQKASGWQSGLDLAPEVEALLASFTAAGMPTGLRTLLLHTVKDMQAEAEALQAVREQLHHAVQRPSQSLPQTGTHLLSGPSGAGKTSMLARLACRAAAQPNAPQVAVVSYRDARLGGWHLEHLVANLPGVEYFRADDATALQKVLSQRPRDGLVLIDTAGTQIAQRVAEVQTVCPDCAVHAVMAADSSTASLNRILQASGIAWTSLMVSKLDESVQPWPLVELLCNHTIALSAASDGSHLSDLRTDLSAGALVEMAVAQLSRVPESVSTQPRLAAQAAALVPGGNAARLVLPPVRLKATSNPRGLRGPFN